MTIRPNPFAALGLPVRPDLDDEQVRAAWRAIAAATHPDRPDGGDLARYTAASAAYAELRTGWGRSEACADLAAQASTAARGPDTAPLPAIPAHPPPPRPPAGARPAPPLAALTRLPTRVPARVRSGRPLRLAIRGLIAAALSLLVLQLIPGTPAAPADIGGLILWFVLTGRKDLAPPSDR